LQLQCCCGDLKLWCGITMLCSPQTPIYFEIMHGYAGLLYIKNGKNYWLMNLWTW
jgi:hypothetical protein